MAEGDWSDEENDAIVADYFDMLSDDLAGRRYNKAEHNRRLQGAIDRRRASIEFKHRNISAVMDGFGQPFLTGYLPADNYQSSLEDAVARWFEVNPSWDALALSSASPNTSTLYEDPIMFIGTPPTKRNSGPTKADLLKMATAQKYDVAERDERNRSLGRAGEERVLHHERALLKQSGRPDLADIVRWVSEVDGDGAGYDIASFEPDGRDRLIEVKTTNGWDRTPFYISRNEYSVADENRESWCLVRVWNFARSPRAFEIRPPLEAHVELTPTSFRAALL
ncbi:MAG: DUF3883 domain-containing protein [Minwuia sp.]|uniref:DUF3883 domain-containing protein n=1 Tax=Minwuia sp. TaxID=2493630 RepID=UPI003A8A98B2